MVAENEEKPRATRTRRKKNANTNLSDEAKNLLMCRCRKCGREQPLNNYYDATDLFLDEYTEKMSVCRSCINLMYERFYSSEKSMDRTILRMCKTLNVKYDDATIDTTQKHLDTRKVVTNGIFGIYLSKLRKSSGFGPSQINIDLTYHDPVSVNFSQDGLDVPTNVDIEYLEKTWGVQPSMEDYEFLEEEYLNWVNPLGTVTHGEEVLIRELCHKRNRIRKARQEENWKELDALIDSFQKTLKASGLEPAMQKANQNGRSGDTWGVWLRDIEQFRPAELYDQLEKYHDMDGIEKDIEDYKRSTKSFVTSSRDFNIADLEAIDGIDDLDEEE